MSSPLPRPAPAFTILAALLLGIACGNPSDSPAAPADAASVEAAPLVSAQPLRADSTFASLIERLSEPGRYFDTDNLISNETSYLHVLDAMRDLGIRGGAYIGVGPDQNFSYIAQLRPRIAFMVDIRRDNLLQHLFFKALFSVSDNRMAFLCHLFARPLPDPIEAWADRDLAELIAYIDETPDTQQRIDDSRAAILAAVDRTGVTLSEEDRETISYIHTRFLSDGLDLRFNSHNRRPQPYYPTFRQLLKATDRSGRQSNYLVREDDFRFLKRMQADDLIIPVVGDLGGRRALREIGAYLREQDEEVTALYTSNVEYYLMGDGLFEGFCENVVHLPLAENSVIIRSYFNRYRSAHPQTMPGHASTQLLQSMGAFAKACSAGEYRSYGDLISDYIGASP